jgi:anion-transporting  ArsA/GET3 family ATPase
MMAKRLVIVTGKGGVGKSTAAAALGVVAARRGLATIVAEVAARSDVARMLGAGSGDRMRESELEPGLHHVAIDPHGAMEEYLREELPGPLPAAILARSRVFELLAAATPGMRELLTIGKVWELTQRPRHKPGARTYDLVVLDAPASGHLLALLTAPSTFGSVARVGPIARQSTGIDRMLRNPRLTSVVAVTSPEQMAVTETLDLRAALINQLGIDLDYVVVNRTVASRFSGSDRIVLASVPDDPAVCSARWLDTRARSQRAQIDRLRRGLAGVRRIGLPLLFTADLGRGEIERLADRLQRSLS